MADKEMRNLNEEELNRVSGGDSKEKKWVTYTVVEGDTLSKIGFIYGCSIAEIRQWNHLSGDSIWAGLRLDLFTINY